MANLKTAVMLFVVTVVFVITFLPAFLMVLNLVPDNIIVFYLYFANNVANPVIYSFMNQVQPQVLVCRLSVSKQAIKSVLSKLVTQL